MSYVFRRFTLSLAFIVLGLAGAKAETIRMVAAEVPKLVEGPDSGLFVLLAKEVARRAGDELVIEVMPARRAVETFAKDQRLAGFPFLDPQVEGIGDIAKVPMYIKRDFVFVKEGRTPPRNFDEMKGLVIGLTSAYPQDPRVDAASHFVKEMAPSDLQNMMKLAAGRIDGFLIEEQSGLAAIASVGAAGIVYDAGSPIVEQAASFVFHTTAEGLARAERFAAALKAMQEDGSYGRILSGQP